MLYFPQLEPTGDRFTKDGGNFLYGAHGEGSGQTSRGWKVTTTGESSTDYKVIRPRLCLPVQDDQRYTMQARVLSELSTTQPFRGIGIQARAFNYTGGPVKQVWRNEIDQDQNLWISEPEPTRWQYLTQTTRVPKSLGADSIIPELLIIGVAGGSASVTSFGIRTVHGTLGSYFNEGPDTRFVQSSPTLNEDFFSAPLSLEPGQDFRAVITSRVTTDKDITFGLWWQVRLRGLDGVEDEFVVSTREARSAGTYDLFGQLEINAKRPYDQFRVRLRGAISQQNFSHTIEVANLRIDYRDLDVVRSIAQ